MDLKGEFSDKASLDPAAKQRAADHDLLQYEIAGLQAGKRHKFRVSADYSEDGNGKSGKGKRDRMSALDLLLASDPQYAALYNDTLGMLSEAESEAEDALAQATRALEDANTALEDTLSQAAKLEDGTRVFRDEKGEIWDEHGNRVGDDAAASIVWNGNEPTHAEHLARKQQATDAQKLVDDWREYQTSVLGAARDRLSDRDNPPSREELERIRQEIEEQRPIAVQIETDIQEPSVHDDDGLTLNSEQPAI